MPAKRCHDRGQGAEALPSMSRLEMRGSGFSRDFADTSKKAMDFPQFRGKGVEPRWSRLLVVMCDIHVKVYNSFDRLYVLRPLPSPAETWCGVGVTFRGNERVEAVARCFPAECLLV